MTTLTGGDLALVVLVGGILYGLYLSQHCVHCGRFRWRLYGESCRACLRAHPWGKGLR